MKYIATLQNLIGGNSMNAMISIAVIVISICCVITIKIFTADSNHDLEVQAGNFRLTIRKHD